MRSHVPAPLTAGKLCRACHGTGADVARTLKLKSYDTGYVRCRACNGNGLDPAEYFSFAALPAHERSSHDGPL